jgi:hypothetical protein
MSKLKTRDTGTAEYFQLNIAEIVKRKIHSTCDIFDMAS